MITFKQYVLAIVLSFFTALPGLCQFDEDYDKPEKDTTQTESENDSGKSPGGFWQRVYFGGNLSLQFGNYTNIYVAPIMGYRITQQLSAGVGVTYQYQKFNNYFGFNGSYNTYGGSVFARRQFLQQFFVHTEYENLNTSFFNPNFGEVQREWVPAFFAGGGFFQGIGQNAGFNIMILYNFLHDSVKSPYNNNSPWVIRAGVTMSPF